MDTCTAVQFFFPVRQELERQFYNDLVALLGGSAGRLRLKPDFSPSAMPATIFNPEAHIEVPQIRFDLPDPLLVELGSLCLFSLGVELIYHKPAPEADHVQGVEVAGLLEQFSGHVVRLDHSGIEIPAALLDRQGWDRLVHTIARRTALYRYLDGKDWPFIIPAEPGEIHHEITDFSKRRTPKVELTYGCVEFPLLHFHVETDLTLEQIDQRLPAGFTLPEAETFRSVYVQMPYTGLGLRIDFGKKPDLALGDWETGRWLSNEGGRIYPPTLLPEDDFEVDEIVDD